MNGLIRDRSQSFAPASIAAIGFGLTAIGVGIDRGWIEREEGADRVLKTLRTLALAPQGADLSGTSGYKGWYYHFLDMETGTRAGTSELSSIDTALLLSGILFAKEYFSGNSGTERNIRIFANGIFNRVDWDWMRDGGELFSHGWRPERGFIPAVWSGYNEAMILYLLALGAPGDAVDPELWVNWTRTYQWEAHYGRSYVIFPPLFGHQYSHVWVDFRHAADAYMREKGITYFENSRRATLAQHAYVMENPRGFQGYGERVWGLTACDGPGTEGFFAYIARGAPPAENDDGTVAPTAVDGSVPFAPEICLPTLRHLYDTYRERIWTGYGFRDAFNLTADWWGPDVIGIDQGPILLMIENYRTGRVWELMRSNEVLQRGMERAGFEVTRPVAVEIERRAGGAIHLEWKTDGADQYHVEWSPDLGEWFSSGSEPEEGVEGWMQWLDVGERASSSHPVDEGKRFYRVSASVRSDRSVCVAQPFDSGVRHGVVAVARWRMSGCGGKFRPKLDAKFDPALEHAQIEFFIG